MKKLLWEPSVEQIKQANLTRFIDFVNRTYAQKIEDYDGLYEWSVKNIPDFWAAIWDFTEIKASCGYDAVVEDLDRFPGTVWFPGARMNFAENLLRFKDERTALIFRDETQNPRRLTYAELNSAVARLAKSMRAMGIKPGDRVAAYMPNLIETTVAMLATTSIGAIWSSCATDLGAQAVLDRMAQIEPRVLITVDGYYYKGKPFSTLTNVETIVKGIPSLERTVVVRYIGQEDDISRIPNALWYHDFAVAEDGLEIEFEQVPFDHPLLIMFSSGTTGKPKCIVQSTGGILINHLAELILHSDMKREDTIFFVTTCSWMMWNWQLSSLAVGASIVLYDGNPSYPDVGALWRLIQDEKVTVFGTSASYINYLQGINFEPCKEFDFSALREISQTGSALSASGFEYVYRAVKSDLHFNSIAGGTDINGCFAIGSPTVPVYAGEIQRWGLGKKMNCYDEAGKPLLDQMGELVCEAPTPSMPLYFWNDRDGSRYHGTYFDVYPGVWRHGDYVLVDSRTHGVTFSGRSDALLKPSGVRIGTAEIYNQLDKLSEIVDSLAVGQDWKGDQRIILFVQLADGQQMTDDLVKKIKKTLRDNASPRHVPARIIAVPDIPYTHNMKKVETSVTNILRGQSVLNRDALKNPESLAYYEEIREWLIKE